MCITIVSLAPVLGYSDYYRYFAAVKIQCLSHHPCIYMHILHGCECRKWKLQRTLVKALTQEDVHVYAYAHRFMHIVLGDSGAPETQL